MYVITVSFTFISHYFVTEADDRTARKHSRHRTNNGAVGQGKRKKRQNNRKDMSIEEHVAKTLSSFLDEADDYRDPSEPFKFGSSLHLENHLKPKKTES